MSCGNPPITPDDSTPTGAPAGLPTEPASGLTTPVESAQATAGGSYPQYGKAPDLSWIAGRVVVTQIQGGCIYLHTAEMGTPVPEAQATGTGPVVGTSVANDTSPPLRDITPEATVTAGTNEPVGEVFVPSGPGWQAVQVRDGDMVVLFGRLLQEDEPREVCPGGTHFYVERVQANP